MLGRTASYPTSSFCSHRLLARPPFLQLAAVTRPSIGSLFQTRRVLAGAQESATNCGAGLCEGAGPPLRLSPRHPTPGGRGNHWKVPRGRLFCHRHLEEKRKLRSILNFGNFSNFCSQKRIANFKFLTFYLKESPSI